MRNTIEIVVLLSIFFGLAFFFTSVARAEQLSIDQIERQVMIPYGGKNVEGRTCVTRAREAEALLTANGYTWRECVKDVYGIRDGKIGGRHMYVEVKTEPTIFYPDGWVRILDVWSV